MDRNIVMENKEIIAESVKVYSKHVQGCIWKKRDIMLSFMIDEEEVWFTDVFLTQEQAVKLMADLEKKINNNKTIELCSKDDV